jgi:hypothetical protein
MELLLLVLGLLLQYCCCCLLPPLHLKLCPAFQLLLILLLERMCWMKERHWN